MALGTHTRRRLFSLTAALLVGAAAPVGAGCAAHELSESGDQAPSETIWDQRAQADANQGADADLDEGSLTPVVTIEARDHRLTVYAAPNGERRFTVSGRDGTRLGGVLTASALARRFPALARQWDTAYANSGDRGGVMIDASLGGPSAPSPQPLGLHGGL